MNSLIIIFVILLLIFMCTSIIFLFLKNRSIALIIVLCIMLLAGFGFILYNTLLYNNQKVVSVYNSEDKEFSIQINHHKIQYEYQFMQFSSDFSQDELMKKIKAQFPTAFFDEYLKQIVIISDDNIYTIKNYENSSFLWSKRYKYILSCNAVSINSLETEDIQVPFPIEALDESVDVYSDKMKVDCSFDVLKKYYEYFSNVKIASNTIEIQSNKKKYIITYNNQMVYFECKSS